MSIFTMQLSIKLDSIRHFFERNLKDVDAEFSQIDSNWDESQAETEDDYGNLMYRSMKREEITLRATYYELNALIEHHLQEFTQEAYWKSENHASTPKTIFDVNEDELTKIKFVTDLKINEIQRLIETDYDFSFNRIPQHSTVLQIREIANSFKHRRGFKDFRHDRKAHLTERHELNRNDARAAIESTSQFLVEVYRMVTRTELKEDSNFDDGNGV